ncbi:CLUMA_CG010499, isoform A [Clunio marinus]|uniref:CLUMA_CG010499, isoform A n=1 Tax=Clunio marinus TaxID=568069 RepID=A0A1J1IA15_9DIPT|nr:CLUMA_CG010499, isoform A [Clunio marinus]
MLTSSGSQLEKFLSHSPPETYITKSPLSIFEAKTLREVTRKFKDVKISQVLFLKELIFLLLQNEWTKVLDPLRNRFKSFVLEALNKHWCCL